MAAHGEVEYATATGNDYAEHEQTYIHFVSLATVGALHLVCFVIGLAVGGVQDHWLTATAIFVFATIAAAISLAMRTTTPMVVMLVLSLLALALG